MKKRCLFINIINTSYSALFSGTSSPFDGVKRTLTKDGVKRTLTKDGVKRTLTKDAGDTKKCVTSDPREPNGCKLFVLLTFPINSSTILRFEKHLLIIRP